MRSSDHNRLMKFQQKYELQEQVTNGAIEVFVCEDADSGLPRLLYLVKADSIMGQISDRDILQRVSLYGPDPAGIILEVGKSVDGSHPFIITTLPKDPLAVQRWVEAYKSFVRKTDSTVRTVASTGPPTRDLDPVVPHIPSADAPKPSNVSQIPVGTPEPGHSSPQAKTDYAGGPSGNRGRKESISPVREDADATIISTEANSKNRIGDARLGGLTGAFTKEFLAALEGNQSRPSHDGTRANQPMRPISSVPAPARFEASAAPRIESDAGNFATGAFEQSMPDQKSVDLASAGVHLADDTNIRFTKKSETGDFTRFMRGFDLSDDHQPDPKLDSGFQLQRVEERAQGEFTKMFGGAAPQDTASLDLKSNPLPITENNVKEAGPLTRMLMGQNQSLDDSVGSEQKKTEQDSVPDSIQEPRRVDTGSRPLAANTGAHPAWTQNTRAGDSSNSVPEPMWGKEEPAGATRVFTPPPEQRVQKAPGKAGPSEYTRIISGPNFSAPPASAGQGPGSPANTGVGAPPPPMPGRPPLAGPPAQPPASPKTPATGGALNVQAAPKPSAAPKKVSYWPVIMVLSLLLLAAIALVLYFWLKPH